MSAKRELSWAGLAVVSSLGTKQKNGNQGFATRPCPARRIRLVAVSTTAARNSASSGCRAIQLARDSGKPRPHGYKSQRLYGGNPVLGCGSAAGFHSGADGRNRSHTLIYHFRNQVKISGSGVTVKPAERGDPTHRAPDGTAPSRPFDRPQLAPLFWRAMAPFRNISLPRMEAGAGAPQANRIDRRLRSAKCDPTGRCVRS